MGLIVRTIVLVVCLAHLVVGVHVFLNFDDGQQGFDSNWRVTKNEKYTGSFVVEPAREAGFEEDLGLVLSTAGAFHAAYLEFPFVIDPSEHEVLVIQFVLSLSLS